MGITRRQFDLGINEAVDELMRSTYQILGRHQDEAFSESEIRHSLGAEVRQRDLELALGTLIKVHAVEKRLVHNTPYYAYGREMDEETWELKGISV